MNKKGIIAVLIFWLVVAVMITMSIYNIDWLRYTMIGITAIMFMVVVSLAVYYVATYTDE